MEKKKLRLAVDLDGCLYPGGKYVSATDFSEPPREGALEWLASLVDAGHEVFIFTSRCSQEPDHPKYKVACTTEVEIAFWKWVWSNLKDIQRYDKLLVGGVSICPPEWGKVGCDVYIDDRAVRYEGGPFPSPEELEKVQPYWKPRMEFLRTLPLGMLFRYNETEWRSMSYFKTDPEYVTCCGQRGRIALIPREALVEVLE